MAPGFLMLNEYIEICRLRVRFEWLRICAIKYLERGEDMREVKGLAQDMREKVAALKRDTIKARTEFATEVANSRSNLTKFKAFTTDLREANKEVETMLGETGSNFPTSEDTPVKKPEITSPSSDNTDTQGKSEDVAKPDTNGVILNPEAGTNA